MKRGDIVAIALQGDFGKPRPALIIQADLFSALPSVTVLPMTGTEADAPLLRVLVKPDPGNGLQKPSQVMVDKVTTVKRDKIGQVIGTLDAKVMQDVDRSLALFLGFAG